jgi:hypothetical protein
MLAAADATAGEQSVVTAGGGSRSGRHPAVDTASPPRIRQWEAMPLGPASWAAPNLAGETPVITSLFG